DVVRRSGEGVGREGGVSIAGTVEKQVAVAHPRIELAVLIAAGGLLHEPNQVPTCVVGNLLSGEALHPLVLNRDEITSDRPVLWSEFNSLCSSFQRSTPGVVDEWIVPEETHRPDVTPRWHTDGNVIRQSAGSQACDLVHVRN